MLKQARLKKGLSQKEVSSLVGISQSYLSKLEKLTFTHSPSLNQIVKLSVLLDIDPLVLTEYFMKKEFTFFYYNKIDSQVDNAMKKLLLLNYRLSNNLISHKEYKIKKNEVLNHYFF